MEEGRRWLRPRGRPRRSDIAATGECLSLLRAGSGGQGNGASTTPGAMCLSCVTPTTVVGFGTKSQAQQFLKQLRERLARFGLTLNASKTRLIEFGRFAARNRRKRGLGKPETFDFLSFTHCCSINRSGGVQILRLTVKKRMRATLLVIRDELKCRRHEPIGDQGNGSFDC